MSAEPPSNVRQAVETFLKPTAELVPGYKLLEKHGRWWYNDGCVNKPIGEAKQCFYNVYSSCSFGASYGTAAYGFAVAENIPFPLQHAWRVMTGTDTIYELTPSWNKPTWYYGILVSDEMLMEICHHNTPACQDVLFATANRWIESKDSTFPARFGEHVKLMNPNVDATACEEPHFHDALIMSIVPADLMLSILCFVQGADFYNLDAAFKTCKAWNALVKERRRQVGCVRLDQKDLSIYQSFDTVYVPTRYKELIGFWEESESYFNKLCMLSVQIQRYIEGVIPITSSFTSTFDPSFRNAYVDMMIGIIDKAPATVWKLQMYKKLMELRLRIYKELCECMSVPPDPNMVQPLPPKHWPAEYTFIVVARAQSFTKDRLTHSTFTASKSSDSLEQQRHTVDHIYFLLSVSY